MMVLLVLEDFVVQDCAKRYSLSFSKGKKPEDKSTKEEKVEESVKIAPPKECTTELSRFDGKLTSDLLGYVGGKIMGYIFLVLINYKKRKDQNYD